MTHELIKEIQYREVGQGTYLAIIMLKTGYDIVGNSQQDSATALQHAMDQLTRFENYVEKYITVWENY